MNKVYSIKCPNCSAPLELLGGKNVATVTCRYCKSVIDLKNNYKVLTQFQKQREIKSPFRIGMKGEVKGIEWTIIGLIIYSTSDGVATKEYWVDHPLYSPIYGYAWLTYDNGVVTFTKKVHSIPKKDLSPFNKPKDVIEFDGKFYKFYECYKASVFYVEGELTFIAKKDDVIQTCEAINPPFSLNKEVALGEIEYSITEYLPQKETFESFKTEPLHKPPFMYPIKPFNPKFLKRLSKVSRYFLAFTVLMIIIINISGRGHFVTKKKFSSPKGVVEFNITNPKHLVRVNIFSRVNNDWIDYEISIEDSNKTEIFSNEGEISYYYGYEGGESWSEGSQETNIYLKVPKVDRYKLYLNSSKSDKLIYTTVKIKEGVVRDTYFWALFFIYLLTTLLYPLGVLHYNALVWKEVMEDEDDD